MRHLKLVIVTLCLALALAMVVPAFAQPLSAESTMVMLQQNPELGMILSDSDGWTLYMFTRDEPNVSNCYDQCAVNWPPLIVDGDLSVAGPTNLQGTLGSTLRRDGSYQATYNGMPLYYWINDQQPGDTTGQNVGGVWFVVNPGMIAGPAVSVTQNAEFGVILTDPAGWTLYLYTRDEPGVSNCYDQCAINWPPLVVQGDPETAIGLPGELGVTIRRDGSRQVTYNDMPLYYWIRDSQPGDTTGQNVGGVWFIINP